MATFVTSKLTGETITINIQTTTSYWKYNNNGEDLIEGNGAKSVQVLNENGEFTITSCLSDGTVSGDITILGLNNNQLTSFDGTGLSGLTSLNLGSNQLTGFTGTGLSSLTSLSLQNNQLTSFDGTGLSGLSSLYLSGNGLISFDGTGLSSLTVLDLGSIRDKGGSILASNNLTSFDGTGLTSLTDLYLQDNPLTTFIGGDMGLISGLDFSSDGWNITTLETFDGTGLSGLTRLSLTNNPLTTFIGGDMGLITSLDFSSDGWNITTLETFDGTGLSGLTDLILYNNQLTSFDGTGLTSLTGLNLEGNQLASFNGTGLTGLTRLNLTNNPLTTFIGGDMGLITSLDFSSEFWNITTLETFDGTGLSSLTSLILDANQLTEFDGTGLTSLTYLGLGDNQITSFNGVDLSSLTTLKLYNNPLTTFIGGDMGLITSLKFGVDGWNITTLETFDGTGLSSLQQLTLNNNQIVLLDVTPITNLSQLELTDNPITPQNWDSILSGLVGLGNEDGNLKVGTTQRTNASTSDYDTLISRNWTIDGTFEIYTPSTFITSKLTGETINIYVQTTTGYWKYNHNGSDSIVFDQGDGTQTVEVLNANGKFTIISCDDEGIVIGDIINLILDNNQLTTFDGTGLSGLTSLDLSDNQLTDFNGTGLSGLTSLYLTNNQLTEFDGTGLTSLTQLVLANNQLTDFNGTGLTSLTYLNLEGNQLASFNGTGLTSLITLNLNSNQLTEFDGTGLTSLTQLVLAGNQLTELDVSSLVNLIDLALLGKPGGNPLTSAVNDSILNQLVVNGLEGGYLVTIGGRTASGTADYDTLISRGWSIDGADLPSNPTWYRFKAPSTEAWDGVIGVDGNEVLKEVWLYQSAGFTYYDFLTTQSIGEVRFNVQGNINVIEIVATQVQVTLQEFSSSGSFTAGIGLDGAAIGYAHTKEFGSWGTLNSGTLPAIPSRYEGDVPAGSIIFSDVTMQDGSSCAITAPILLSLTVNDNEIDLNGVFGNPTGTPITEIGLQENDEVTFSMTWGELVEATPLRKLRVKGLTQRPARD